MLEFGIYLHKLKKDWHVWSVGFLFAFTYLIGEMWHFVNTGTHVYWSGYSLPGEWHILLSSVLTERYLIFAIMLIVWYKRDKRQVPYFIVYVFYLMLDGLLFLYNCNISGEWIIYLIGFLIDIYIASRQLYQAIMRILLLKRQSPSL